ncbi:MAG: dienelactone hydrolase family protein [Novosphingobium sp.]
MRTGAIPGLSIWLLALLALAAFPACAAATEVRHEHFEAAGKGPPLVMISGAFGEGAYRAQARRMAARGYDVLLIDSRDLVDLEEEGLRAVIAHARASPHALPGKVSMIGFSLGGGQLLAHAAGWPEDVGAIVIMYPATAGLGDPAALAAEMKVPVLFLTGVADRMGNCCTIEKAREIASAALAARAPLSLVAYPGTGHDFVLEGTQGYNRRVATNAWSRTFAWLQRHFARGH